MPDFNKISPTARGSAYALSFCDIPYAEEIVEEAKVEEFLGALAGRFGLANSPKSFIIKKIIAKFAPLNEGRFRSASEILKRRGIKNILEIAAGLSPRGLAITADSTVNYVETDLPEMLAEKERLVKSILAKQNITRPNLKFFAANALDFDALAKASEHLAPPIAIINEGLLTYLTMEEKIVVAQNIHRLLKQKKGVWISPDFQPLEKRTGIKAAILKKVIDLTGRDTAKNSFQNEKELSDFLRETNFKMEAIPQLELMGELACAKRFNISPEDIQESLGHRKIYILSALN